MLWKFLFVSAVDGNALKIHKNILFCLWVFASKKLVLHGKWDERNKRRKSSEPLICFFILL